MIRVATIAIVMIPTLALAEGPLTIDAAKLNAPIVDLRGNTVLDPGPTSDDPKCERCLPLTVGSVAGSCLARSQGKGPAFWALAQRLVATSGQVTLTIDEIHAIKECVDKLAPMLAGQVDPVIDPSYKVTEVK